MVYRLRRTTCLVEELQTTSDSIKEDNPYNRDNFLAIRLLVLLYDLDPGGRIVVHVVEVVVYTVVEE